MKKIKYNHFRCAFCDGIFSLKKILYIEIDDSGSIGSCPKCASIIDLYVKMKETWVTYVKK